MEKQFAYSNIKTVHYHECLKKKNSHCGFCLVVSEHALYITIYVYVQLRLFQCSTVFRIAQARHYLGQSLYVKKSRNFA